MKLPRAAFLIDFAALDILQLSNLPGRKFSIPAAEEPPSGCMMSWGLG
jgi:hypothetical protein